MISKGVDLDLVYYTQISGLPLQGGITYADTTVSPFTAAELSVPSRFNSLFRLPGQHLGFARRLPRRAADLRRDSARQILERYSLQTAVAQMTKAPGVIRAPSVIQPPVSACSPRAP